MVSRQRLWLTDLLEGLPSVAFILLWRQSGELELAGWVGSGLALVAFAVFFAMRARMNPVLFGVNLHILVATPIIVGVFYLGFEQFGRLLASHAHSAVLLTVFLTGLLLTLFSKRGFVSAELPQKQVGFYSVLMTAASAFGVSWAFLIPSQAFLVVIATLALLIVGRRFLLAQWADRGSKSDTFAVATISNPEPGGAEVSA